jgi:glucosamine--fructose-6-phosphate aminotransferase (isomerizing)
LDSTGGIAVVHNGIVDNVAVLRERLREEGCVFHSETDSEVLPHLIRKHYEGDPVAAVRQALSHVQGTYGIAVLFKDHPGLIVAARLGSPLVIGLGDGETFLASDPHALIKYTRRVIFLEDGEIAEITADAVNTSQLDGGQSDPTVEELEPGFGTEDKGDYPHFMLKEIHEQPESIARCLRGRVLQREGTAKLGGLELSPRDLAAVRRFSLIGCGTSFHAAMLGAMAIESVARVPASAEIASEYRHRNPVIDPESLSFAISQSGETFDTLGAIKEIQLKGGRVLGVVNSVGSSIARLCGAGVYVHSGPEIAVASTKAFTSQVTALYVFTLMLGRTRTLSPYQGKGFAEGLLGIPENVQAYLNDPGPIHAAVDLLEDATYALFMGRGPSWPVAMEGALKLKELAYIPCEAFPAGEMKHGPIAMLEEGTPVIVVCPDDGHRSKTLSNLQEVRARGAKVILIHNAGDAEAIALADVAIAVPKTDDLLTPLVTVLPLQLLAYQTALRLGREIDRPRNLAKSVTVE